MKNIKSFDSIENFWNQINEKFPELIPFIIDYSFEDVTFQYHTDDHGVMRPLFMIPTNLPIKHTSVTPIWTKDEESGEVEYNWTTIVVTIA